MPAKSQIHRLTPFHIPKYLWGLGAAALTGYQYYKQSAGKKTDVPKPSSEPIPFPPYLGPPDFQMDEKKVLGKRKAEAVSILSGVEETWIGPKGNKARSTRRKIENAQNRLLEQSIAFGSGSQVTGATSVNIPERVQSYQWNKSSSFSCGWGDSKDNQGECNYSLQAPIWQFAINELRQNIGPLVTDPGGNLNQQCKVRILEANATWTFRNNSVEPAELTVWRLKPRRGPVLVERLASADANQPAMWFPFDDGESVNHGEYAAGVFKLNQSTQGLGIVPSRVPVFDGVVSAGPTPSTYAVDLDMPVCMSRSYGDTNQVNATQANPSFGAINAYDYYNSPQDFKAITENFEIEPAYHRWFNPGDMSILKASIPYSLTMGRFQGNNFDPTYSGTAANFWLGGADEACYAWRDTWGPLYLFRIRGAPVYDGAYQTGPTVADAKTYLDYLPIQKINFGSAILNCVFHSEWHACLEPYPEERFQYRTSQSIPLTSYDQMAFDAETHSAMTVPGVIQGDQNQPPP